MAHLENTSDFVDKYPNFFFLKWAIPGLFSFIFVFSIQLIEKSKQMFNINFANDWFRIEKK